MLLVYPTLVLHVGVLKLGWGGLYFDRPLSRREANNLKPPPFMCL